jgi:hypothetical protein
LHIAQAQHHEWFRNRDCIAWKRFLKDHPYMYEARPKVAFTLSFKPNGSLDDDAANTYQARTDLTKHSTHFVALISSV